MINVNFNFIKSIIILLSFPYLLLAAPSAEELTLVQNDKVCMVTDMVFPRTQIPVKIQGKTYYGCCESCKGTLSKDDKSRLAIDPISGKSIDKAKAVIAARNDGSVLYFESRENFEKYKSHTKK